MGKPIHDWESILEEAEQLIHSGEIEATVTAIGKRFEISRSSIDNALRLRGMKAADIFAWQPSEDPSKAKFLEVKRKEEDGTVYSKKLIAITDEDLKSDDRLLELHGLDPKIFEIIRYTNNYWNGIENIKKGGNVLMLRQSKLYAKPRVISGLELEDIDNYFSGYKAFIPKKVAKRKVDKNGDVFEVNLADLHIAKKGVYEDEKTIKEKVQYTIEEIKDRLKGQHISKIYLTPGGDLAHFDGVKAYTSGGTLLETDGMTFNQAYDLALDIFIYAITELSKIAPVEYLHIPGNHDEAFSYYVAKSLEMNFKNDKNVTIDTGHLSRKVRKIGVTVIGWCHQMSKANMHSWIQVEARDLWANTKYAEVHTFHFHHQTTTEKGGVIVRSLPSLSSTDMWHYNKGFIGAQQTTVCFRYSLKKGMDNIMFINV